MDGKYPFGGKGLSIVLTPPRDVFVDMTSLLPGLLFRIFGAVTPFFIYFSRASVIPTSFNLSARDVNVLMEGPLKISTKPPDNHTGCPRGREKRFTS